MKYLLATTLLAFSVAAVGSDDVLLGRSLIGKGDSATAAREAGGEPQQLDRIPGDESSPAMEIWTYRSNGKTVTLWLVADKVVKAQEQRSNLAASGSSGAGTSSPR